ncbi:ATP-binding protein [Nonomuraea sp. NPDC059194]|uniref:ATP-binding protein n=1 Tax=Nonomuraea sp. NPDC059194 TaxID=3346764 RepID=UPI0036B84EDD
MHENDPLYGRAAEQAAITDLLSAARKGQGQALVIRGDAGIGKSALVEHAVRQAGGLRVLRATGAESETGLAFAALHQLLHPVTADLDALPEPQRDAVAGALGLAATRSDDRFLVAAGVLSLLIEAAAPDDPPIEAPARAGLPVTALPDGLPAEAASPDGLSAEATALPDDLPVETAAPDGLPVNAAATEGLLVVVDDFQWIDQASADAVLFAARRLGSERIAMLLAVRGETRTPGLPELPLTGLDQDSAATLLTERAERAQRAERAAPAHEHAAPPRHRPQPTPEVVARLVELTGGNPLALRETVDLLSPAQLAGTAPLPEPLPVGAGIFGEQVRRLPEDTRRLLLVAALEGRGDLDVVLKAADTAEPALRPAEAAGLVSVDSAIRFRHPLVRSAVHAESSAAERRAVHGALAVQVADPDRRAWHRAAATVGQDEEVAADLAASAERARARGGYADAATALVRAAELTPEPERRAVRLAAAATSAWLGGRPGQAESCLAEARALADRPEFAQLRGRFELNSGDAAEAMRILSSGDTLEMLADASEAASYVGDVQSIVAIGRHVESFPEGFLRDAVAGIGAMLGGDRDKGALLLRRALGRTDELEEPAAFMWAAAAASYLGEADVSAELATRAGRAARVSGVVGQLPVVLEFVATAERIEGRFALSAAIAQEGLELAREAGYTNSVAAHLANLAAVAAVQGREDDCARMAHESLAIAIPHHLGLRASVARYALGLLDLGMGRHAAAHDRFAALAVAGHPTAAWRSTPDRVEAAVGCGELDAARAAVAAYERWSADARTPQARALLARCRALTGDDAAFGEAMGLHPEGFERARTALLYGERLRRLHRPGDARSHLRYAMETFERAGADPWARRAGDELRAAGETRARPERDALGALTPQELRIAKLVAAGASSKEVAAQLFLSPRTVEYHLYKIYPKLGVSSRTELALVVLRMAGDSPHEML